MPQLTFDLHIERPKSTVILSRQHCSGIRIYARMRKVKIMVEHVECIYMHMGKSIDTEITESEITETEY